MPAVRMHPLNALKKIYHFFKPFQRPGKSAWWPVPLFVLSNAFGWWAALTIRTFTKEQMNWVHIGIFCLWTLTLSPFCHRTLRWSNNLARIFLVGVAAALTAEASQFYLPRHVPLWGDVCFSSIGVSVACLLLWTFELFFQRGKREE